MPMRDDLASDASHDLADILRFALDGIAEDIGRNAGLQRHLRRALGRWVRTVV